MTTPTLFDQAESEARKEQGMAVAADKGYAELAHARSIAITIALASSSKCCTADDVGRQLKFAGFPDCLGPAAGSLFKGKDWKWTGRFVKSARKSNHARLLRVWEYAG